MRSPRKPAAGIIIPAANKKPEVSHCTVDSGASKYVIIAGRAILNMVMFNVPIKAVRPKERVMRVGFCLFK